VQNIQHPDNSNKNLFSTERVNEHNTADTNMLSNYTNTFFSVHDSSRVTWFLIVSPKAGQLLRQ